MSKFIHNSKTLKLLIFLILILLLSIFFIFPTQIAANGDSYGKELVVGAPEAITTMRFYGAGYGGYWKGLDYGKVGIVMPIISHWVTSTSWDIKFEENLPAGDYFYRIAIQQWDESGDDWVLIDEIIDEIYYFTVGASLQQDLAAEPIWIRDTEMKCKVVWINEDNMFQFSFIYPYADNNWVKIYDMSGKEVFSIDMPYDNPNIIVDLPDGMYTVKTFNDQPEPIQEFVIGKP